MFGDSLKGDIKIGVAMLAFIIIPGCIIGKGIQLLQSLLGFKKSPKIEVVASPENLKGNIFVVDKKNPQTGQLEKDTVFMFSLKASDDFREAVTPLVKDGKVQVQQTVVLKP